MEFNEKEVEDARRVTLKTKTAAEDTVYPNKKFCSEVLFARADEFDDGGY